MFQAENMIETEHVYFILQYSLLIKLQLKLTRIVVLLL
jgi:hypothetical protein